MIFFFGSGRGGGLPLFLLAFVGLLFFLPLLDGGGGLLLVPLLMLAMFFVLPVLFFRSVARGASRVLTGGVDSRYGDSAPVRGPETAPVDRADVVSLRDRLAHDVSTLQPDDDPVSRQALADASERYSTCTSLLERARTADQLRTAWLAAAEGLHATRLVRQRLGLDPGPAPVLPDAGPHLQQRARVRVSGQEHVGAPSYEPGRPHWFPGGRLDGQYVPGGWYATPFWPGSLVLGVLGGWALGSLAAGAASAWGAGSGAWGSGDWSGDGGWGGGGDWSGGGGWGDGGFDGGGGGFGGGDFGGDW